MRPTYRLNRINKKNNTKPTISLDDNNEFPELSTSNKNKGVGESENESTLSTSSYKEAAYMMNAEIKPTLPAGWTCMDRNYWLKSSSNTVCETTETTEIEDTDLFDVTKAQTVFEKIVELEERRREVFIEVHGIDYYNYYYTMPNYEHMPEQESETDPTESNQLEYYDEYDEYDY